MGFSAVDYVVLLAYLAGITVFGMRFRKAQRSVKDYFVGARQTPWIIICLSIVATETSTLTLIGVPALAYGTYARPEQGGTLTYLQVLIGYIVGLAYGGALMIDQMKEGKVTRSDAELLNYHLAVSHSVIEDNLLFVALGVSVWWILGVRLVVAWLVVWVRRIFLKMKRKAMYSYKNI